MDILVKEFRGLEDVCREGNPPVSLKYNPSIGVQVKEQQLITG